MEYAYSVWQIVIIALVAGVLIGALAYRLLSPSVKQADQVKSELDQAREDMESYRESVNSHFNKTSELVNNLTQDYVKVYQHLAEGAQTLGDSKTFNNLLEQKGKVVISVEESAEIVQPETEPAPSAETIAEQPDEHAKPFVAAVAAAKPAGIGPDAGASEVPEQEKPAQDESAPAASSTAVQTDASDSDSPVVDKQPAETSRTVGDREADPKPGEPVIDLAKIDTGAENSEASKVAAVAATESEEKGESRPVTH